MAGNPKYLRDNLIEKLYDNTCTQEEIQLLFRLINEDSTPPAADLIGKLWEQSGSSPKISNDVSQRILSKAISKIALDEGASDAVHSSAMSESIGGSKARFYRLSGIAASLLVLITLLTGLLLPRTSKAIVQTEYGEQQTLELADGSKVLLNANSQMIFQKTWSDQETREVWLEGEAFFDVQKKPTTGQGFKVKTDDITIEVLGTSFNVNNHGDKTSVYLEEGEIRLYFLQLDSTILMQPGDLIRYHKISGRIIYEHQVHTDLYTSWKNGVLIFRDSPLREVLEKIEETYGVEFELKDSVDYLREINFPLPIHELEKAISILQKTMGDLEIEKVGEKYIIK
ncbi:MAG: FecR domain-containing protein [Saprospiraceae bacterium]|nr:FecR domain-containing protein [Saprospiraceae bacterium]